MNSSSGLLQQQSVASRGSGRRWSSWQEIVRIAPAALLVITLSAELWVRIESLNAGYRVERLREEALRNDTLLRELKFEYAALAAPLRTAERAKQELAMVTTSPHRLRRVSLPASNTQAIASAPEAGSFDIKRQTSLSLSSSKRLVKVRSVSVKKES